MKKCFVLLTLVLVLVTAATVAAQVDIPREESLTTNGTAMGCPGELQPVRTIQYCLAGRGRQT